MTGRGDDARGAGLRRLWVFRPPPREDDGPSPARYRYLNAVFYLCGAMMALYLAQYNVRYHDPRFNVPLAAQLGFFALAPLLYRATRSYALAAWFVGLLGSAYVVFHAFIAGGFASPGLFWLAASPLTLGILVRRPGVLAGGAIVVGTLLWFGLVGPYPAFHDFAASRPVFEHELAFNMWTFAVYSVVTTHVFISNEDQAMAAIQRQKHEIDSLLRIVVHDIAGPLTAAQAEVDMLAEDLPAGADPEGALARVDAALVHAATIISGVRSVRALKDGKLGLTRQVVDLGTAARDAVALLEGPARDKGLRVHVTTAGAARVVADALVLRSIVLPNVLSNAIKFTPDGRAVEIVVGAAAGRGFVRVRDEGVGIPDALMPTVFAYGKATTRPGTRGEVGTGYGLPLVREYVDMMGGAIAITSSVAPGASGTEVEITLPLAG